MVKIKTQMHNLVLCKDCSFSHLEDITNNKVTASSSSLKMIKHTWLSYNYPYYKKTLPFKTFFTCTDFFSKHVVFSLHHLSSIAFFPSLTHFCQLKILTHAFTDLISYRLDLP